MKKYSILLSVALCAVFALLTSCEQQNPSPEPSDTRVDTLCLSARFYFCDDMDTYLTHKVTMSKDDGTPVLLNLTRVQKYDSTEERNLEMTKAINFMKPKKINVYYADALYTVREPGTYTFKVSYEKTGAAGEEMDFAKGSNVVSMTKKSKRTLDYPAVAQSTIHFGIEVSKLDAFLKIIEKDLSNNAVVK